MAPRPFEPAHKAYHISRTDARWDRAAGGFHPFMVNSREPHRL